MSEDAERIKRLVEFKKKLEKNVEELDSELREQQAILDTVNALLLEKGFKRGELPKELSVKETSSPKEESTVKPESPFDQPSAVDRESSIPLKAVTGELLANLYVSEDSLRVVPAEDKSFNINMPPFTHFLVERVLAKMQERDSELVKAGQLTPEKIFCYNIVRDGDAIHEIIVKNADSERLRELKSSIRWTLEKMYEKMKAQS